MSFALKTFAVSFALAGAFGCARSSRPAAAPAAPGLPGALTIAVVSPTIGIEAGGTRVTITGSGFLTGPAVDLVEFAATLGTNVQVLSDTKLLVDSPAGSGSVSVRVRRSATGQSAQHSKGFLYYYGSVPAPILLSLTPALGPDIGGTTIQLSGSAFQTGASVSFGGTAATNVVVATAFSLTCTVPAGSPGSVSVLVQNPDLQSALLSGGFQYVTIPVIASVAPSTSWTTGGVTVTVTGSNFAPGATVTVGSVNLSNVIFVGPTRLTGVSAPHTAGTFGVTVTNVGGQSGSLSNAFTYVTSADSQTAAFTFDTAAGIDCRRRWYVNMNAPSFVKDVQNRGLQTWGTPGDATPPPFQLALVDALALDWMRAYVLATLNVKFGRNADGSANSGTSINITFTGMPPTTGARGCLNASTDWSEICIGGCDQGIGGPHPLANQVCALGILGRAAYDRNAASSCNQAAEHNCNAAYHNCTGCSWASASSSGNGVFSGVIGTQWIASMGGGALRASDHPHLDGTITTGLRYSQVHDFLQQYAYRIAYVTAHEIGHSTGLVATSATGTCTSSSGLCGTTKQHNSCCGANIMRGVGVLGGSWTQTSRAFSGQPGGVTASSTCSSGGVSSWALLQSFAGTSP